MKAAELIAKVQECAKKHEISALAACKKLKIPHGRYYAAVGRTRKATGEAKRAGATVKAATQKAPAQDQAATWNVTAVRADVESGPLVRFIGTSSQVADLVRSLA